MMKAEVLTPRVGTGTYPHDGYRPKIMDDYALPFMDDKTGQQYIADPNLMVLYIECDAPTLAAIEADNQYHVLWSES